MGQNWQNYILTMKSSLYAAYIIELIYFSLKITQNITIKSKTPANKSEYTPLNFLWEFTDNIIWCATKKFEGSKPKII